MTFGNFRKLICGALATLALSGISGAMAQGGPSPVEVDTVRVEPLSQTFPVLGRLIARQSGVVAALTRGPVAEVLVDVGDRVAEGDVVARLALDRLEQTRASKAADLAERGAERRTATAVMRLAEDEMARLEKLKGSAAFSKARYDDKRREVAVAKASIGEADAAIARARADLRLAEIDLSLGVIKAPFSGVVTTRYIERGAYVNVGDPAVALVNDRDLEIEADVPSNRLGGLTPGRSIQASLSDTQRLDAVVRALVPEENALTRTRQVRFIPAIDEATMGKGAGLAAGQTVSVLIPVGEARDVLTVHKDAILSRSGGDSVYLVVDGKAMPKPVTLGVATGDRFVVKTGLSEGDVTVIRGNERLRPGQAVAAPEGQGNQSAAEQSTDG